MAFDIFSCNLPTQLAEPANRYRFVSAPIPQVEQLTPFGQYIGQSEPFMCDTGYSLAKVQYDLSYSLRPQVTSQSFYPCMNLYLNTVLEIFKHLWEIPGVKRVLVSVRNFFAAGDVVWHVDRSSKELAIRLIWALGRQGGTLYTPRENVNLEQHAAFMRREHPLLSVLDCKIYDTRQSFQTIWRHRPQQVEAMLKCHYSFIKNQSDIVESVPNHLVAHQFQTSADLGSFHCGSVRNETTPGLQTIFTVTS